MTVYCPLLEDDCDCPSPRVCSDVADGVEREQVVSCERLVRKAEQEDKCSRS